MGTQPPSPKGHRPQFLAHVCCGQTAGFIKMPLRTEIGLGPRPHCVRWGPSPSKKGHTPNFGPCLFWPNGWMDQDATWYGGRPQPSRHCVRWGASSPYQGVLHPHFSAHVYAKRLDGSRCHLVRIDLIPRPRCIRLGLGTHLSPERGTAPPLFGPCLLWPNGRPSQLLLSACYYNSSAGTDGPILTIYTPYDVFPRKEVPL